MRGRERLSELDYLRLVERLAREVTNEAAIEGWLAFGDEGQQALIPLHRAINALATNVRMVHYEGDGCLDQPPQADDPR